MTNRFEAARREYKVSALVNVIDLVAVTTLKLDPLREADVVAARLRRMDALGWAKLADRAGVLEPSPLTRAGVLAVYDARAEQELARRGELPTLEVRWYEHRRGVLTRRFHDRGEADRFAVGRRLYARPAEVREVSP